MGRNSFNSSHSKVIELLANRIYNAERLYGRLGTEHVAPLFTPSYNAQKGALFNAKEERQVINLPVLPVASFAHSLLHNNSHISLVTQM